jgi:hypothetical protein
MLTTSLGADRMRRRDLLKAVVGAAVVWGAPAFGQSRRLIGILGSETRMRGRNV